MGYDDASFCLVKRKRGYVGENWRYGTSVITATLGCSNNGTSLKL